VTRLIDTLIAKYGWNQRPPTWQELEARATPWQAVQRNLPYEFRGGEAPANSPNACPAPENWNPRGKPTRFYDGFDR